MIPNFDLCICFIWVVQPPLRCFFAYHESFFALSICALQMRTVMPLNEQSTVYLLFLRNNDFGTETSSAELLTQLRVSLPELDKFLSKMAVGQN